MYREVGNLQLFFTMPHHPLSRPGSPHYRGFTIKLRHTAVGRTPLDEWSARHRDLYLTTHNTHNKHPCPPVGFEITISVGERSQTYALDCAATGTGRSPSYYFKNTGWAQRHFSWLQTFITRKRGKTLCSPCTLKMSVRCKKIYSMVKGLMTF
jgi:hypothetical protein